MSEPTFRPPPPTRDPLRWAIIIAVCAGIIGWGLLNYALIPDRPRTWDFGALPDVPAESVYSTSQPAPAPTAPRQFPPLPEASTSKPVTWPGPGA